MPAVSFLLTGTHRQYPNMGWWHQGTVLAIHIPPRVGPASSSSRTEPEYTTFRRSSTLPSLPMIDPAPHDSWRALLRTDRTSIDFPRLAKQILDTQTQTTFDVSKLTEDEVTQLIDLIDTTILRHAGISGRSKGTAFTVLRRLCGTFERLPESCLINEELKIDDGMPFATRAYADLRKGKWKGERVAVKLLRFSAEDDKAKVTKRFCKEMVLWKQLRHKNLLPFYGAYMIDRFGIVSPWLGNGNIGDFTRKNPDANRLRLLIDAAEGLEYLHHCDIVHGNLRGTNILITDDDSPRAVLSDFGLTSIIFNPFSFTKASVNWIAPELLSDDGNKGPSLTSDIYSLSMVIYEVLTGAPPFANRQKPEVACKVVLGDERPPLPRNSENLGITSEIWRLLERCWIRDVDSRPAIKDVLRCLKESAKGWVADAAAFLVGSEAGFKEVMKMNYEKAQKLADDLDKALESVGVDRNTRKYLKCLQKLCGASGVLPRSFVLDEDLEEVEKFPFARGGFSDVFKAIYKGERVVVKALRLDTVGNETYARTCLAKEVVGWKWLRHDNILPFVGVTSNPLRIISPWMENGNILKFLKENPGHNPFGLLADVSIGLQYLHAHDFVHGDLKGANILIDSEHRARLADFGLARIIEDPYNRDTSSSQKMGTMRWSAPEYLDPERFGFGKKCRKRVPSKSTDIYALGMTILEAITQRAPFEHMSVHAVPSHVVGGGRPERPPVGFSDELWKLLGQSWVHEYASMPTRRPDISLFRAQLEKDGEEWVSVTGISRVPTTIETDETEMTPSSPITNPEPILDPLLEQIQDFLGIRRPAVTPTAAVIPTSSLVPFPVAAPSPVPPPQVPPQGPPKTPRWNGIQKFLDGFRRLWAKFIRASREPFALSRGLVPEREENGEVSGTRYGKLF